jgi:hypothetical protein
MGTTGGRTTMKTYRFIHDPGHGWLEIPTAELVNLGIAGKISRFSYQSRDRRMAYLEEDCDVAHFDRAMSEAGFPWDAIDAYQDPTFVRQLPSYQPPQQPEPTPGDNLWTGRTDKDTEPPYTRQQRTDPDDQDDDARTLQAADAFYLGRGWEA